VTAPLVDILALMAESAAMSLALFDELEFADVVDPLQEFAERTGLVAAIGQDAVQEIISAAFVERDEVPDDYAAQLVRQWGMADSRDRWRHTGEPPPASCDAPEQRRPTANRVPQTVIDAFKIVLDKGDAAYLADWLRDHAEYAAVLLDRLEEAA
jgi:hypothetical protein